MESKTSLYKKYLISTVNTPANGKIPDLSSLRAKTKQLISEKIYQDIYLLLY